VRVIAGFPEKLCIQSLDEYRDLIAALQTWLLCGRLSTWRRLHLL